MEKNEMEWKLEFGNRSIWLDDRIGLDFWIVVYLCEEYEGKNIPKNWLDGILECRRGNKHFRIRWKQNNQSRSPHMLSICRLFCFSHIIHARSNAFQLDRISGTSSMQLDMLRHTRSIFRFQFFVDFPRRQIVGTHSDA